MPNRLTPEVISKIELLLDMRDERKGSHGLGKEIGIGRHTIDGFIMVLKRMGCNIPKFTGLRNGVRLTDDEKKAKKKAHHARYSVTYRATMKAAMKAYRAAQKAGGET